MLIYKFCCLIEITNIKIQSVASQHVDKLQSNFRSPSQIEDLRGKIHSAKILLPLNFCLEFIQWINRRGWACGKTASDMRVSESLAHNSLEH